MGSRGVEEFVFSNLFSKFWFCGFEAKDKEEEDKEEFEDL